VDHVPIAGAGHRMSARSFLESMGFRMARQRVLVVDDDRPFLNFVQYILARDEFEVEIAASAEEALARLQQAPVDLLLTDIHMAKMEGLELIQRVKAEWPGMVIVIMTGYGTAPGVMEALRVGAVGYVLKPFTQEQIVSVVKNAIEKDRLKRENIRVKSLASLFQFSWALMRESNQGALLGRAVDWIKREARVDHASIILQEPKGGTLVVAAVSDGETLASRGLDEAGVCNMAHLTLARQEPFTLLGGVTCRPALEEIFGQLPSAALRIIPIVARGKTLGVLSLLKQGVGFFLERGVPEMLAIFTRQIAIILENARLVDALQEGYRHTLEALVTAINLQDRRGGEHASGVERYALRIGERLAFTPPRLHGLSVAAMLHDIGKMGSDEAVLSKEEKLTSEEYEQIKKHALDGANILDPIRLPDEVGLSVLHHHERWDGAGYPHRLSGEAIPLYARIIAIADAFDAMTSMRSYRGRTSVEAAGGEIIRHRGTQFDPTLVDLFMSLDDGAFA